MENMLIENLKKALQQGRFLALNRIASGIENDSVLTAYVKF